MRALAILILIASVSCKRDEKVAARADPEAKKGATPAAIVISKRAPPIGLRVREEKHLEMAFEFEVGATKQKNTREESSKRVEEVLAVDGLKVTKLRVTYEERDESGTLVLSVKGPGPSPVVSKTYVVDISSDAGIHVTDSTGKPPPAAERTIVESDYQSFATDDVLSNGLPDTPLHVGDPAPTLANALRNRLLGMGGRDVQGDIEVSVDRFEDHARVVVFKVDAKFTLGSMKMIVPMVGTVKIRASDGWLTGYSMRGELQMGDSGPITAGSGTTKIEAKRTYL